MARDDTQKLERDREVFRRYLANPDGLAVARRHADVALARAEQLGIQQEVEPLLRVPPSR